MYNQGNRKNTFEPIAEINSKTAEHVSPTRPGNGDLERLGCVWGASLGRLGASLGRLSGVLGRLRCVLGTSWGRVIAFYITKTVKLQ